MTQCMSHPGRRRLVRNAPKAPRHTKTRQYDKRILNVNVTDSWSVTNKLSLVSQKLEVCWPKSFLHALITKTAFAIIKLQTATMKFEFNLKSASAKKTSLVCGVLFFYTYPMLKKTQTKTKHILIRTSAHGVYVDKKNTII